MVDCLRHRYIIAQSTLEATPSMSQSEVDLEAQFKCILRDFDVRH